LAKKALFSTIFLKTAVKCNITNLTINHQYIIEKYDALWKQYRISRIFSLERTGFETFSLLLSSFGSPTLGERGPISVKYLRPSSTLLISSDMNFFSNSSSSSDSLFADSTRQSHTNLLQYEDGDLRLFCLTDSCLKLSTNFGSEIFRVTASSTLF